MSLNILNGKIRLYNYELSPIGFPSQYNQNGIFLRGRDEAEQYVMERVSLDDIEMENTKSDIFKVGRVRFHPSEEDEIYTKLGIEDRENIKSDKEMIEWLMDSSLANVKKISNIKSSTLISRMKSMLFRMERGNNIPPHNISSVVKERNNELRNGGIRNKDSEISRILDAEKKSNEENKLKDTVEKLSQKVEQLEKDNADKDEVTKKSQTAIEDLLKLVDDLKGKNRQEGSKKADSKKSEKPKKKN